MFRVDLMANWKSKNFSKHNFSKLFSSILGFNVYICNYYVCHCHPIYIDSSLFGDQYIVYSLEFTFFTRFASTHRMRNHYMSCIVNFRFHPDSIDFGFFTFFSLHPNTAGVIFTHLFCCSHKKGMCVCACACVIRPITLTKK